MYASMHLYFQWQLLSSDLRWVAGRQVEADWSLAKEDELVLAPRGFPFGWDFSVRKGSEYQPLESCTGLFRELARLDDSPEAIQAFAEAYGPLSFGRLFVPTDHSQTLPRLSKAERVAHPYRAVDEQMSKEARDYAASWVLHGVVQGDSLADWRQTIHKLRALVAIWDAIQSQDHVALKARTRFVTVRKRAEITLLDESGKVIDGPRAFSEQDSIDVSLFLAAECALTSTLAMHVNGGSSVTLHSPKSNQRNKLALVPRSLRDAIWLQFTLAVIEHKKFGACEVCGKPFEISPQVARTNRKLCGSACKAKAHRQRREQALRLADSGRTPKQIAKQVGSHLTTVQKWLAEAKGEE